MRSPRSKQSNESLRYTDEGITVVALDRHGRGLHRARPEGRDPTARRSSVPPRRSAAPLVVAVVVAGSIVTWLLLS